MMKTYKREIMLRLKEDEQDVIDKIDRMKKLFNEKTDNKTLIKIIREFRVE